MAIETAVAFDDLNYLWLGSPDLSKTMLKRFDPAYTGNVHIFLVNTPPLFTTFYADTHAKALKAALEKLSTSLTGIPELNLNYQDQTHGFADRKVPHATYSEVNFDQATVRCLELKGLPVQTMVRDWIENISDPISKIKDYQGRASQLPGGYTLENHTCSFITCTADPTNTKIQGRAHYIMAASPTNITNTMYEWNGGEISIVDGLDISFRGVLRWGDAIDTKAAELLAQRMKVVNYYANKTPAL